MKLLGKVNGFWLQIVLRVVKHHNNIVPWQILAHKTRIVLEYIGLASNERLDMEQLKETLNECTKLVSTFHVSNTQGCCVGKGYSGHMPQCPTCQLMCKHWELIFWWHHPMWCIVTSFTWLINCYMPQIKISLIPCFA